MLVIEFNEIILAGDARVADTRDDISWPSVFEQRVINQRFVWIDFQTDSQSKWLANWLI